MGELENKYSNLQIYGFFGLLLTNTIWTFYALDFLKVIPLSNDVMGDLYDMLPILGIYVGIPLVVSLLILHRMHKRKMANKSNYFILLISGFTISALSVASGYFL